MKKHNKKDLTQVKGGYVGAGFNFESVGSFVFMNIYKPKPLPSDIVNRCLEELSSIIGQLEIKNITHAIDLPVYQHQKSKLAMQVIYYRECKRLFEKGKKK